MGPRRGLAKKRVGAERTPEGKPICFRYNAPNGCKNGAKCHFAHVCSLCFQNRYWKALHLSPSEAENGRAWIGGFLELVDGCHGPWFSLEVKPEWAP